MDYGNIPKRNQAMMGVVMTKGDKAIVQSYREENPALQGKSFSAALRTIIREWAIMRMAPHIHIPNN